MSETIANAGVVALLAIVPLVVLMLTSFVKVSVVLSLLRNAIGATDAPSGLVVMGLSLILTFFVMAPVAVEMITAAASVPADAPGGAGAPKGASNAPRGPAPASAPTTAAPTSAPTTTAAGTSTPSTGAPATAAAPPAATTSAAVTGAPLSPAPDVLASLRAIAPAERRGDIDALGRALEPLKGFLAKHASERDVATFVELGATLGHQRAARDLAVLAPAFVTTELREAFAIAVLVFLPFLVIDLLVGLGLAALGLQTSSPQVVALPFKLLLFVAVDGWRLLIDALLRGYA